MRRKPRRDARVAEGAPLLREYRVKNLIEGSNPSLSARYAKRPARGVLRIWRREVVDEPLRFDKFVWNEFGRPKVGPGARQRVGVRPMDGPNNPPWTHAISHPIERAFCVSGGERWWTNPSGFDEFARNKFGQPQAGPAARQRGGVRPMDGPNNPAQTSRSLDIPHRSPTATVKVCRKWKSGRRSANCGCCGSQRRVSSS